MADERKKWGALEWTAVGTVVLALVGLLTWLGVKPGSHGTASLTHTPGISPTPLSSSGTLATRIPSVRRNVVYLDASAPTSGGPVGRGLASISGQNFPQSIWMQFAESCCGSQQSVVYSVPSGYREFVGMLGEQEVDDLPSGYTMLFSVSVNGLQVMDDQQVQLGDPPVPFQVPLPADSATIQIDVTGNCPNIYCVGNAVIGNARIVPIRARAG